jgi:hypothetical protein
MLAFVALRDGCVTNEDELEHARRRLANLTVLISSRKYWSAAALTLTSSDG